MTFKFSKIDDQIYKDETFVNNLEEVRRVIYKSFKIMIIASILCIVVDLLLLYFIEWLLIHQLLLDSALMLFLLSNISVLALQIIFPLLMGDPSYQGSAIKNIKKRYKPGTIDAIKYILDYRDFENAIRENTKHLESEKGYPSIKILSNYLRRRGILSIEDVQDIAELTTLRNIIVHEGGSDTID